MHIPAQAFGETYARDIRPGSLLVHRGSWAMRIAGGRDDDFEGFIMLEGDRAGQIIQIGGGMVPVVTIVEPFTWFPAASEGTLPSNSEMKTATLTLASKGPVVIGGDVESGGFDTDYYAFHLDGSCQADFDIYRANTRFVAWTAELQHSSKPFESLGRLFSIERISGQPER